MLMTIRYESGLRVEAVVLTADRERMRVAIDTQVDTTELRQVDACWHMEDGSEVEIEALIPITDASGFWGAVPLTNTAGQSFMVA